MLTIDNPSEIDELYRRYSTYNVAQINDLRDKFITVANIFDLIQTRVYRIIVYGVSHIYGLWGLAWELLKNAL